MGFLRLGVCFLSLSRCRWNKVQLHWESLSGFERGFESLLPQCARAWLEMAGLQQT